MIKYIAVFLFSVFISSVSQIMLKTSTKTEYQRVIDEYLNPRVIVAYIIFFCSSLLTIFAYKYVPLSMGPILEASGYIFVTVLGYFCLHETIGKKKALGMVCILAGIAVSYL
ncbi:MAG: EamA family transporter [Lachnospiraceae bacterium]|nr:EamA family transporter [Lachnospiraceae bacterium]